MLLDMANESHPTVASGLEVLDKGSATTTHPTPLLFIHGAWHAAWCWEYFLDFFAEKGYHAFAVSLRGHGGSASSKKLRGCSLADFLDDVKSAAATLPARPVVIGHSLGGLIVQKYLESNAAPAGVLMASAPPQGSRRFTMQVMRRYPWFTARSLVTGDAAYGFTTPVVARELFFSARTPECDVVRHAARLGNESHRVSLDALFLNLPKPQRVTTPLLVLGAEHDGCITRAEVNATAAAYGTVAEFFAGMGHDMMIEPGWEEVAARIESWLTERGL
jgi:pimeloyl-ACP methyl ester carboxylesterase